MNQPSPPHTGTQPAATHLADCTATELLDLYRRGSASPVEATRAVLDRIDALNPRLNAFCLVAHEQALAQARDSEARWRRGEAMGALDGVPVSIKDLILTRGWPTLRGSRTVDPNKPWPDDAPATARLREAGAVLLGKTTTPEFGCKGETNSPLTGITRNPWDPGKTPGGSSGGTAAAVAAGLGPLSVGTDGAGSVRIPAAFCGTFGLKPSFGRVPAWPLSPFGTVAHLGPHTMNVRDAALMLEVLKQPDARDWTSLPPDPRDNLIGLDDGIRGWRIAYSPTLGYARNVDAEVAAAVHVAVQRLQDLGAHVEQIDPCFEDPLEITTGLWFIGAWTVWNTLTPEQQALTDPDFRAEALLGECFSALDIQRLHLRRGALGAQMRHFMQRFELLVTPSVAVPAFEARPAGHTPMSPQAMLGWTPFSYPFNLTQQPACTIPCGLTRAGLPIGLQIVGPMFGDAQVLRAARAYESTRPIPRPPALRAQQERDGLGEGEGEGGRGNDASVSIEGLARRIEAIRSGPLPAPPEVPRPQEPMALATDDLTMIDGIDAAIEAALNAAGYRSFRAVAEASADELGWAVAAAGPAFSRADTDRWRERARRLTESG